MPCRPPSGAKIRGGSPLTGSTQRVLTGSIHSIKVTPGRSNDSVTAGSSTAIPAGSLTAPVGSGSVGSCDSTKGWKDGLVHHAVDGPRSRHLSHVPPNRTVLGERENSVPVSVFLDNQQPQLLHTETVSEGLLPTVNLGSFQGNSNPRRSASPARTQVCEHRNVSMPPSSRSYGSTAVLSGTRPSRGSGTVSISGSSTPSRAAMTGRR